MVRDTPCGCAEVVTGAAVSFYRLMATKIAAVLDVDEMVVAVDFRPARYCVNRRVNPKDLGGVDWNPASERVDGPTVRPSSVSDTRAASDSAG